jgi:kynurenine formamidase
MRPVRESNWRRWGDDDEAGALNLLTPERLVAAAGLVRTGRVFQLGLPIQTRGVPYFPHRPPAIHYMARDGGDYAAGAIAPDDIGTADDYLGLAVHGTTHVDALCHLWYGGELYNGFSANEVRSSGAARNGIDKIPPIVGRGVLLDVAALHGVDHLEPGHPILPGELTACEERQGVAVGEGDVLLVRTGWHTMFDKDESVYHRLQPGVAAAAIPWLVERDVVAVGADNGAVERFPDAAGTNMPVHRALIRDYGVHLIELLMLEELAAAEVHEFLFVAAPLRIKRGAGSPLNPLAIA